MRLNLIHVFLDMFGNPPNWYFSDGVMRKVDEISWTWAAGSLAGPGLILVMSSSAALPWLLCEFE